VGKYVVHYIVDGNLAPFCVVFVGFGRLLTVHMIWTISSIS